MPFHGSGSSCEAVMACLTALLLHYCLPLGHRSKLTVS
uniref:Uncharacterized protein n=1 Tax=Arundo donax TaxID=35708 RepID=A0A0A9GL07_ARUDO